MKFLRFLMLMLLSAALLGCGVDNSTETPDDVGDPPEDPPGTATTDELEDLEPPGE